MSRSGFDVVVIGGGPAGSMTAYHLARAGIRVAVIDAKVFPREKACGGGLQARAAASIPFDLSHVLRGTMRQVALSYGLGEPCTRAYPEPLVYGVLRTEFDNYLLEKAESAGAAILQGTRVTGFSARADGRVVVHADCGTFAADLLVGADGANSVVSRLLNKRENYFWQAAIYCEIPLDLLSSQGHLSEECMRIDWGSLPSGYGWVFPKRGYVNVGAGGPVRIGRLLRPYVSRYVQSLDLLKNGAAERLRFNGHQLPTVTRRTRFANRKVLLVGDAAGLVEPFTGDGMSSACHSARVAAECIRQALESGNPDASAYDDKLWTEIGAELLVSRKLLSLSVAFPEFIYRLFRQNDRIWHTFCRILRGEESFRRLKKDILGPLEYAWKALDLITQRRERKALAAGALADLA